MTHSCSRFALIVLLLGVLCTSTFAMTQIRHNTSEQPQIVEFNYQQIFSQHLKTPSSLSILETATPESCEKCIEFFQQFLPPNLDAEITSIDNLAEQICTAVTDPFLHVACVQKANDAIAQVAFTRSIDIDWKAIDFCAFLSICEIDCCSSHLPEQIYMTVGNTNRDRNFMFTMRTGTGGVLEITSAPNLPPDSKMTSFPASAVTYTAGQWKGYIHSVTLTNMAPGQYYYRVGVPSTNSWSHIFSTIIHADDIGSNAKPLHLMAFGDIDMTKYSADSKAFIKVITGTHQNIHAALLLGDLGYSDCAERKWGVFLNWVQEVFTENGIPLLAVPGNHESLCYQSFQGYQQRFPNVVQGKGKAELYYSVNYGKLHVNMLNSEHTEKWNSQYVSDEQLAWLKDDLTAAKAAGRANWYISTLHRPLFCSWSASECNNPYLRERLEQPFNMFEMDMVLYGHVHAYERSTQLPMTGADKFDKSNCTWDRSHKIETCSRGDGKNGPVYVLTGAPGNSHSVPDPEKYSPRPWSSAVWMKAGFGILTVTDDQLVHQFADSATQQVIDTIVINKK